MALLLPFARCRWPDAHWVFFPFNKLPAGPIICWLSAVPRPPWSTTSWCASGKRHSKGLLILDRGLFHLEPWSQATVPLEGPPRSRPMHTSIQSPVGRLQWTVKQGTLRITEFMVVGWDRVWKNKYHLLPQNAQSLCICGSDRRNYFMGSNPGNYHGNLSGKWKGCVRAETIICSCCIRTNGTGMDKSCRTHD